MRRCPGLNQLFVSRLRVATLVAGACTFIGCLAVETAGPTLVPVASVPVSPGSAVVVIGDVLHLTATPRDPAGKPLTGRPVTWTSSDPSVAIVSNSGVVTAVGEGSATITATSEGQRGTATVTVQRPLPLGAGPDPTLLPVAARQLPDVVAYTALQVATQPAGFSYNDPVSGVKVWKVTSGSTPAPNSGAGHDYADGANQVSRGWGANNNTHTLLIRGDGMAYYLVDFTRGAGFSNYRVLPPAGRPNLDLRFTFSSVAGHSRTNQLLTHAESWVNEPRLERDGRYVVLTNGGTTVRLWDLSTNTFGPTQTDPNFSFFHNADLRSQWVGTNNNADAPFAQDRYVPSGGQLAKVQFLAQSAGPNIHHAGNWVQSDAELGGNLNRQWSFVSGFGTSPWESSLLWQEAIGVERSDGSDQRLLVHHYSLQTPINYFSLPFGMPSPDGKVVIFNSNMNGSDRYDLFVAEVPLR